MELAKTLSREDMKTVKAGIIQESGSTNCVICWNEGGAGPAKMVYVEYGGNDPSTEM